MQSDEEERKRRAAIVQERIEHGVCRKCGAAPALPGRQLCSKCAEHKARLVEWWKERKKHLRR